MTWVPIDLLRKRYRKSPITIKDIARMAHVSPGTVSKALNHTDRVSNDTRERVLSIATKLGWRASPIARGLVLQRSHLIGLVVSSITNDFCAQLYEGAEGYAVKRGYGLLLCITEDDHRTETKVLERLRQVVRCDGAIAIPAPSPRGKSALHTEVFSDWPYVLVARHFSDLSCDYVICDDIEGGRLACSHLIGLGHQRIGFVYDIRQRSCSNAQGRMRGYKRALAEAGIKFDPKLVMGFHLHADPQAQEALSPCLREGRPTALFVHNDRTAVAVMDFLRWAKLEVPRDVALIGYGNFNLSRIVSPQLTTVDYNTRELGRLAAEILIDRIEGRIAGRHQIIVQPRLVIRESTGPTSVNEALSRPGRVA